MSEELDFFTVVHKYKNYKGKEERKVVTVEAKVKALPLKTKVWADALEIYEHNQNVYIDLMNKDKKKAVNKLKELEEWFTGIKEPKPEVDSPEEAKEELESWKEREEQRKSGISAYCDLEVREILKQ
jgi:hypothetical protein